MKIATSRVPFSSSRFPRPVFLVLLSTFSCPVPFSCLSSFSCSGIETSPVLFFLSAPGRFFKEIFKIVPFRIWPGILRSDEAIVAVMAHEVFELEMLRPILKQGATMIEDFIAHTRPGNPGNLHDKAWDLADAMVEHMRKERMP